MTGLAPSLTAKGAAIWPVYVASGSPAGPERNKKSSSIASEKRSKTTTTGCLSAGWRTLQRGLRSWRRLRKPSAPLRAASARSHHEQLRAPPPPLPVRAGLTISPRDVRETCSRSLRPAHWLAAAAQRSKNTAARSAAFSRERAIATLRRLLPSLDGSPTMIDLNIPVYFSHGPRPDGTGPCGLAANNSARAPIGKCTMASSGSLAPPSALARSLISSLLEPACPAGQPPEGFIVRVRVPPPPPQLLRLARACAGEHRPGAAWRKLSASLSPRPILVPDCQGLRDDGAAFCFIYFIYLFYEHFNSLFIFNRCVIMIS